MQELQYRGRRFEDLEVTDISWPDWCADHIMTRTTRYQDDPDELDIEPEWATEAALDPYRQLSLTQENDLRVTGWAADAPQASWSQRPGSTCNTEADRCRRWSLERLYGGSGQPESRGVVLAQAGKLRGRLKPWKSRV